MRSFLHKTRVLVSVNYAYMMEYRAEIVLWMLSGILPFILMGVWVKAAGEADFAGLAPADFARYFLAVFLVRQVGVVWVLWDFEQHVLKGWLSPFLLQPMDPAWRFFAGHVGERGTRAPFVVLMIVFFFLLYPQALVTHTGAWWTPSPRYFALGLAAAGAAFILRYLMQSAMAMFAFWTERVSNFEQIIFILQIFLSGSIAPLEVYPPAVRAVIHYTPFPYLIYFPAKLLTSTASDEVPDIAWGFAMLALWSAILWVLYRWLWRIGLKRYSAMGA